MKREDELRKLTSTDEWDIIIIGGGASGLGAAIDAAHRGYKTVLFEGVDFAKGTSSRSTKLVHGGVRYLAQGDVALVFEALKERGLLARNAPHLFRKQRFIIPVYSLYSKLFYGIGLKVYDFMSLKLSIGGSRIIGKKKTLKALPNLQEKDISGGIIYWDGQFDDSRLSVNMAQTAIEQGACVLNHMKVVDLLKDEEDKLYGVKVECQETGEIHSVKGKVIINATGVFANKILKMAGRKKKGLKVVPSQGIHLVIDGSFLNSETAIMIPKTSDGRVLFIIPWKGKAILGTTDTPIKKPSYEPQPLEEEIEFILDTAATYLKNKPERKDVLSVFAGLRPLVAPEGDKKNTKEISRGHKILISDSGLISIMGGKWTTYRKMAEELVEEALRHHQMELKKASTEKLMIHGGDISEKEIPECLKSYGSDAEKIQELIQSDPNLGQKLHTEYDFTLAQIKWAITDEMARTIEDILARRIRLLFLDARAAKSCAERVSHILANTLDKDEEWRQQQLKQFLLLADQYDLNKQKIEL